MNDPKIFSKEGFEYNKANQVVFGVSPIDNGGPIISYNGRKVLQFSTNDYLGLSRHPELRDFASEFVKTYGIGTPMGPRPISGNTEIHLRLEKEIAEFKKSESSLTFSTGAITMTGTIASLLSKSDALIIDQKAHISLYYGGKLSGCDIKRFKHNDLDDLEKKLKNSKLNPIKLIVVDGVYSMIGDIAP